MGSDDYKNIRPDMMLTTPNNRIHEAVLRYTKGTIAPAIEASPNRKYVQGDSEIALATEYGSYNMYVASLQTAPHDTSPVERRASSSEDSSPYTSVSSTETIFKSDMQGSSFQHPKYGILGVQSQVPTTQIGDSSQAHMVDNLGTLPSTIGSVVPSAMKNRRLPVPTPSSSRNASITSAFDSLQQFGLGASHNLNLQASDQNKFDQSLHNTCSSLQRHKPGSCDSRWTYPAMHVHQEKGRQEPLAMICETTEGYDQSLNMGLESSKSAIRRIGESQPSPTHFIMPSSTSEYLAYIVCSHSSDCTGQADFDFIMHYCTNYGAISPKAMGTGISFGSHQFEDSDQMYSRCWSINNGSSHNHVKDPFTMEHGNFSDAAIKIEDGI